MLADLSLPPGSALVRTTPEFTVDTVPAGLLSGHRVAPDTWGLLCVREGEVQPDRRHRVEPGPDSRFVVEFHR